jgi:DNA polymerase (family 10)
LEEIYPQIDNYLKKLFSPEKVSVTGAYRRQELTIDELEYIILEKKDTIKPKFQTAQPPELLEETVNSLLYKLRNGLRLRLYTDGANLTEQLFLTTGSKEHGAPKKGDISFDGKPGMAERVCNALPYIPPCLRESGTIEKAKQTFPSYTAAM